jgi:hypothetical protein
MKIIQALKELKLLDKRINDNCDKIAKYSSAVEGYPAFETEQEQEREVAGLVQSNVDLVKRRSELRMAIYKTNMQVVVDTPLGELTIAEAIILRDAGLQYLLKTYASLCDNAGASGLRQLQGNFDLTNPPKIKRYYKEVEKNNRIEALEDFLGRIDGILEVVNAETEIIT